MPIIVVAQQPDIKGITVQNQSRQIVHETLSQKYPTQKRASRVAKIVEYLTSKYETLSSNPRTIYPTPKKY
jgi:hypothetical protein